MVQGWLIIGRRGGRKAGKAGPAGKGLAEETGGGGGCTLSAPRKPRSPRPLTHSSAPQDRARNKTLELSDL